ncbi:tRNA(His) guanylyltransferase Thg1 family protein [Hymenobacter sp. M29]|uniref:tRNA(His) guanylyltransferase n=1 Tax=Hymenobacter mellowenesis TaxID=3063995 RepID=A0ABT9ADZ3_9BACT|nr:tRNA(His) guanylyltransferase Thg1 family protein [Hymenobacter sp. M29]MDO7848050.1 tRNA(His) guanylyltransferase Thg1 family protein [Hymenobacter sp. M29]
MRFDELDARLRVFETAHDHCALPGIYLVARLDGRNFTRLTKETHAFERPFDERFRDLMVGTVHHLMQCGFRVRYGYSESDEISLLLDPAENTFGRKLRKYQSILAGEASAKFSLLLGSLGTFDCRIAQLPRPADVVDYFRWRAEDALRNSLNAHCYWLLRTEGATEREATSRVSGLRTADKHELLFERGINFNDLPAWQKRGFGLYWQMAGREGFNPLTQQATQTLRRELHTDFELPVREAYTQFIQDFLVE